MKSSKSPTVIPLLGVFDHIAWLRVLLRVEAKITQLHCTTFIILDEVKFITNKIHPGG